MSNNNQSVHHGEETEVESDENHPTDKSVAVGMADETKSQVSEQSDSEPRYSWLHEELAGYNINDDHIQHCENNLIVREGFTSRDIFANTPKAKITHDYLETISITSLGVQSAIISIHSKLCEEMSCMDLAKVPMNAVKWLRSKLHSVHTLPYLQNECEWKIVVQEGITSKDLFASLPDNVFNATYLRKIGIEALGMQHVLLEWHAELHFAYLQQLNFMARSRNNTANNNRNNTNYFNNSHSGNKRRAQNRNTLDNRRTERAPEAGETGDTRKRGRDESNEAEVD